MITLEKAIAIAATAHQGQVDTGGSPYILHPLRVMLKMSTDVERIVAVLHDVLEDTNVTEEFLREVGVNDTLIQAIDSVTRREDESYKSFIVRANSNPIGRVVKIADIEDNMDLSRIPTLTQKDYDRIEKYRKALQVLQGLVIK